MKKFIDETLFVLGVPRTYRGYYATYYSVRLVLEDETRLLKITDSIYKPVAQLCGCKQSSVERNIRTVIFHVWKHNRELLCTMAGHSLASPPSVSRFIDILSTYIQRKYLLQV